MWGTEIPEYRTSNLILGGKLGQNPLTLIGSVLFHGDPAIINEEAGIINKERVIEGIKKGKELIEGYGLQFAVDFVIPSTKLVDKVIELIAECKVPAFVDSTVPDLKISAYRAVKEYGVNDLVIANGIDTSSSREEIEALKKAEIKAAVLLVFNPKEPLESLDPKAKISIIKNWLLPMAKEAGIDVPLLDAVVLDPASIILSAKAIRAFRSEIRLPSGCAPANALGPVSKKTMHYAEEAIGIHSSVTTLLRLSGADFIFYGPVRRAKYVASAAAIADALLAYELTREKVKVGKRHPLRTILRDIQRLFARNS